MFVKTKTDAMSGLFMTSLASRGKVQDVRAADTLPVWTRACHIQVWMVCFLQGRRKVDEKCFLNFENQNKLNIFDHTLG